MCRVLEVSRSGYFRWLTRKPSQRQLDNHRLDAEIRKIYEKIRLLKKPLHKARRLAKKLGIQTTAFAFLPEERPVCEQDPRSSMFIRYDGTVGPCINLAIGGATTFLGEEVTMPSVHYGRLPQDDLMDLWESDTCRFYRQRFAERAEKHERTLFDNLSGSGGLGREQTQQAARESMPEPPSGCNVCHYLYDI
jgi:MoaA/NifB/PqqE/SkfB family radical SAM enzyme